MEGMRMNEPTITLTVTRKEHQVLERIVFEAFQNAPLTKPEVIAVMTLNTKLNKNADAFRRARS